MIFTFSKWEKFCAELQKQGIVSISAKDVRSDLESFLVLKHDIENTVSKAYRMAEIEHRYGQRGTYYAHAYLLDNPKNVELLKKMQQMGHEISYHYDVMDSNHGDISAAAEEFENNCKRFEQFGFSIETVCQHGNPVVERVGYTSNRDFFRRRGYIYPQISDVMVDFKEKRHVDYTYFSDAGRVFKLIFDPITNDINNSDDKNIAYEDLNALLKVLPGKAIISTHPHRWTKSQLEYTIKTAVFKIIKNTAKLLMRIPILKKFMSRYYYLAKKI